MKYVSKYVREVFATGRFWYLFFPRCSFRCVIMCFITERFLIVMVIANQSKRDHRMWRNRVESAQNISTSVIPRCTTFENLVSMLPTCKIRTFLTYILCVILSIYWKSIWLRAKVYKNVLKKHRSHQNKSPWMHQRYVKHYSWTEPVL